MTTFTLVWLSSAVICTANTSGMSPSSETSMLETIGPVSFRNDVVPVLTKLGCNTGTCHAKAGGGQNGFQLSLFGFEPDEDYDHLVWEARGRRVSPAAPDQSLLLLKASGHLAHGGGVRMTVDSEHYQVLRAWISQGAPRDPPDAPELVSIEAHPASGVLERNSETQLTAIARYSDQTQRDVTSLAIYETNDPALIECSPAGLVHAEDIPGKASVMVRFQGKMAVYSAAIPRAQATSEFPPSDHFIDRLVFRNLETLGIPASPICDDDTFLRRVTLDIAGRLPTLSQRQAFHANSSDDRRAEFIDELLESPGYADTFANKWTSLLKNRRDEVSDIKSNFAFHAWIRDSLLANRPYDEIVRELLAATGTVDANPAVAWYKRVKEPNQQIEDVAQLFLGVRVQCAQCHHHPFERWSQDDYYALSAFFTQIGRKPSDVYGEDLIFHDRGIAQAKNIKSGQLIRPLALGDSVGQIPPDEDPRLRLADWMADADNPFFAKALVNRYWKHFVGRGLVEPEDDIRDTNPPTNPELLEALEQHFVDSGFDLKSLVRAITTSKTYQLSSLPTSDNLADRQNYSWHYPQRLQAEVMLDAINDVTATRTDFANLPLGTRAIALPDNSYNKSSEFLRTFGRPEATSVCECERVQSASLAQSLHFLNANEIRSKIGDPNGRAASFVKAHNAEPPTPAEDQVRELYRIAFSREVKNEELATAVTYLTNAKIDADGKPISDGNTYRENMEDLIWAIINSKEFLFNH
ncbi:DUF1549 and DUF1553 domain-containing protein [Rubripirellula amarantea]|nr:DUF1549 and DUF1553 domain-containing protein [Rubripirellula amarantea]